jgi:hypothetical protein
VGRFALLDPDPDPADQKECGTMRIRIRIQDTSVIFQHWKTRETKIKVYQQSAFAILTLCENLSRRAGSRACKTKETTVREILEKSFSGSRTYWLNLLVSSPVATGSQ